MAKHASDGRHHFFTEDSESASLPPEHGSGLTEKGFETPLKALEYTVRRKSSKSTKQFLEEPEVRICPGWGFLRSIRHPEKSNKGRGDGQSAPHGPGKLHDVITRDGTGPGIREGVYAKMHFMALRREMEGLRRSSWVLMS